MFSEKYKDTNLKPFLNISNNKKNKWAFQYTQESNKKIENI